MGFVGSFFVCHFGSSRGLATPLLGGYLPIAFRIPRNQRLNSGTRSRLPNRLLCRVSLSTALAISIAWILLILILSTPLIL
jgi:hypothetical protein